MHDLTQLTREAWQLGKLRHLLLPHQLPLYDAFRGAPTDEFFIALCSRRFGKTTILMLMSFEDCLRKPGTLVRFATDTQTNLQTTLRPIAKQLLATCPSDMKPRWRAKHLEFYNGSELHMAGTDNGHEDDLRGNMSHLNVVDEAGKCSSLKYVVKSVMLPMTLTTGGKTILASTPSISIAHEFYDLYQEAKLRDSVKVFTIDDNTALTEGMRVKAAKDCGGAETDVYQREYMCKWVTSSERRLTPEWDESYVKPRDPNDKLYPFWKKHESMDIGWSDRNIILFGHYNFQEARLYVEREHSSMKQQTTSKPLGEAIKQVEKDLGWERVDKRIADNNDPRMLTQLALDTGLYFTATGKDSLEAMLNKVRTWLREGRIHVDPSCKQLIGCLEAGIWNTKRDAFDKSSAFGHFDALAALVYLVRNCDVHTNPVPFALGHDQFGSHVPKPPTPGLEPKLEQDLLQALNIR